MRPGLGQSIGYNAPGIAATVYLYTMGLTSVPDDVDAPALREHFEQACRDITQLVRHGIYREARKLSENTVAWGSEGERRMLHAEFRIVARGAPRRSHLYLAGFRNHFLKIRFTCEESAAADGERLCLALIEALGRMAAPPR